MLENMSKMLEVSRKTYRLDNRLRWRRGTGGKILRLDPHDCQNARISLGKKTFILEHMLRWYEGSKTLA